MNRSSANGDRSSSACRRLALFAVVGISLSVASGSDGATVCVPSGSTCTGTRSCATEIFVPSLDTTFSLDLTGPALATLNNVPDMSYLTMNWVISSFSGSDPTLGNISVSLDPAFQSTGVITPVSSTQPTFFPAINTNDFFFDFQFSNLGNITLVTNGPAVVQGLVNAIPPDGSVYSLLSPVDLYMQGDPTETTVAIIESATINFMDGTPVNVSSPCPEPPAAVLAGIALVLGLGYLWFRLGRRAGFRHVPGVG